MRQYLFPDYYPKVYEMFKPEPGEMIGVHIGEFDTETQDVRLFH